MFTSSVTIGFVLLLAACKQGSVGHEPVARCVPAGQCSEAMFHSGLQRGDADLDQGRVLYQANCAKCHGPGGEGTETTAAVDVDFTSRVWHEKWSDEDLARIIVEGRPPNMPPVPLSEPQLRDVIAYVRSLQEAAPTPTPAPGYGGEER
ncbi:MAG: c-type cytochrome [Myxococcota bacterium]